MDLDETNKARAKELAREIAKLWKGLKFDFSARRPISERLVRRSAGDMDTKKVQFPVTVVSLYGMGVNAVVLKIRDKRGAIYAMKIGYVDSGIVELQNTLASYEMAPRVYYVGTVSDKLKFLIMDKIQATLESYLAGPFNPNKLYIAIKCLLDKKTLLGLLHGDMHTGNIAVLKDGSTLGYIDFDFSIQYPVMRTITVLDFIPFVGSFISARQTDRLKKLTQLVLAYYKDTFRIDIEPRFIKKSNGYSYQGLDSYIKLGVNSEYNMTQRLYKVFFHVRLPEVVP
jgi:hypothetical protein